MKKPTSTELFFKSLTLALILLGGLFGVFHHILLSQNAPAELPLTGVKVPDFTAADNTRFLFIYDADLSGEDLFCAVISCSASAKTVFTCALDLRCDSLYQKDHAPLRQQYRLRGQSGLKGAAQNLLQQKFDAVIRCDNAGLKALAAACGGIDLTKEELSALDGVAKATALQFSTLFLQDVDARDALFSALIRACFAGEESLRAVKAALFANCDTDFSAYDVEIKKKAFFFLADEQSFTRLTFSVHPVSLNGQTLYCADADALSALQRAVK